MLIFLFHLLLLTVGYLLLGRVFEAALHRSRVNPVCAAWVGVLLVVLWPTAWSVMLLGFALLEPFHAPIRDLLSTFLSRAGEYRLGAGVGLVFLFWLVWSAFSLLRDNLQIQAVRRSALDLDALEDESWHGLAALRLRLEAKYRQKTSCPSLSLRISDEVLTPFSVGFIRPDLYAPLWMFSERGGTHLRVLLDREVTWIGRGQTQVFTLMAVLARLLPFARPLLRGLKLALDGCVDRAFLRGVSEEERARFLDALRQCSAAGRADDGGLPFGRNPLAIQARIRFASEPFRGRGVDLWALPALMLPLVMLMGVLGPVPFRSMRSLMSRELPPGVIFLPYSSEARAVALPGQGGDLRDGVLVDTTRVKGSRCHLDLPYWGWRDAFQGGSAPPFLRVSFDFEAIPAQQGVQPILLNGYITLNREDAVRQVRQTLVLDEDIRILPAGRGRQSMVLALDRPHPFEGWRSQSGPSFRIPAGWRVRITRLRAEPARQADWAPRDLEASYRLLEGWRQAVGACHPLNLDW